VLAVPLLAEGASGIGALGVDLNSLIVYLINFGVLLAILYFFAYKKILGVLDQRAGRIKESLDEAERVRIESEERQAELQRAFDEGREESKRLLAESREMAERYREEQAVLAQSEAARFKESAREDIRRERDAAIEDVRQQFADLAVNAAERIIHRSLDAKTHQSLIEEVLDDGVFGNNPVGGKE
tara:strand:+ start:1636 stop:2190 length:555 start_codon:yes stop_codon:yes gene_type:complete